MKKRFAAVALAAPVALPSGQGAAAQRTGDTTNARTKSWAAHNMAADPSITVDSVFAWLQRSGLAGRVQGVR